MASNKRFKGRNGTIKEDVCFVGVVAWDNLAVSCRDNLTRGSSVLVTGELQSRKIYSDEGAPRNMVEIKAKKIQFLDVRRAEVADPQAVDALADVGNALPEN